jgi:DNA-binding NarL/FixJ family response regulator
LRLRLNTIFGRATAERELYRMSTGKNTFLQAVDDPLVAEYEACDLFFEGEIPRGLNEAPNLADPRENAHEKPRPSMALIDPMALTRGPIGELLAKAFPGYALITASTCEELLETADVGGPHLVVVYTRSAGLTNTWAQSALELLRARLPEASVVVLSDKNDLDDVNQALTHGARGYIPSCVECEIAFAALRLISAGGTFVPAAALRSTAAKPDDQDERKRRSGGLCLTPRELSVLDLLREGKPNKLIARQLDMQESTVKVHVRNILRKLGAANRTHAVFVANQLLGQDAEPIALPARVG